MGKGSIILLISLVGGFVWLTLVLYLWLPDQSVIGDLVKIIQASVASIAIVAGGAFAVVKFQVFRDFAPHVTISQTVSHRTISESYVHIFVTATLYNSSKVKVDLRKGYFRIQAISPVSDSEVEELYADVFVNHKNRDPQWKTIDEALREWMRNSLIVEPGESHQETCEFIVGQGFQTVLVNTYLFNSRKPKVPEGWGATSVYDIVSIEASDI